MFRDTAADADRQDASREPVEQIAPASRAHRLKFLQSLFAPVLVRIAAERATDALTRDHSPRALGTL